MADAATIKIQGEKSDLDKALNESESAVKSFADRVTGSLGTIGDKLNIGGLFKNLFGFAEGFIKEATTAQEENAALQQTLKQTGEAAGFTFEQMEELADSVQSFTKYTGGAIKGAENMLAKFKNIKGDVFKDALTASADLGVKMGGIEQAAASLGRALADPESGLKRLRQAGVQFTDAEEELIKALVRANDVAEAQRIILQRVNETVGGQAAAAASTLAGKWTQLSNRLTDAGEKIGTALLPALEDLIPYVEMMVHSIEKGIPVITDIIKSSVEWAATIFETVKPALETMAEIAIASFTVVQVAAQNFGDAFWTAMESAQLAVISSFETIKHWLTVAMPEYLAWFGRNWKAVFKDSWEFLKTVLSNMWENMKRFWDAVMGLFNGEGFQFEFKGLTEGFKKTMEDLPKIAERAKTETEKSLEASLVNRTGSLMDKFKRELEVNKKVFKELYGEFFGGGKEKSDGSMKTAPEGTPEYYAKVMADAEKGKKADGDSGRAAIEDLLALNARITQAAASKEKEKDAEAKEEARAAAMVAAQRDVKKAVEKVKDTAETIVEHGKEALNFYSRLLAGWPPPGLLT